MVIPSLYTRDDQALIERWMQQEPAFLEHGNLNDSGRVAEIALSSVQARLPQSSLVQGDDSTAEGRKSRDCSVQMRNNLLTPIHIFESNRVDAHSGLPCIEEYYATLLPGYNIYVVTISYGSENHEGFFDLAIGSFRIDNAEKIIAEASRVVLSWWQLRYQELSC